jgi:hypothetical protein
VIQQVLKLVDYSFCSEAALTLFFAVFVAIAIRTSFSDRKKLQGHASRAIQDHQESVE